MNMFLQSKANSLLNGLGSLFLLGLFLNSTPALATQKSDRALFLQAETALAQNKLSLYQSLKNRLLHYPLYPYLEYAELSKQQKPVTLSKFKSFVTLYHDSPLAIKLRTQWLQLKLKEEDWPGFLQAYQPTKDLSMQCSALWAQLKTSAETKGILEQIQPLWLQGKTPPKSCEPVFQVWEKSALFTRPLLWQKIKLAIQENNALLARTLAKKLNPTEIALVELWIMVHHNPYLITEPKYFSAAHPAYLEMLVHGACEIAKSKPEIAIQVWQQINRKYPFTERHWGLVVRAIGISFAKQRHPEAEKWLSKVPAIYTNPSVHEWRIRSILARKDWHAILHWFKSFPEELLVKDEWKYWHARALDNVGRTAESQTLLSQLAPTRSYYGFLASHQLLKPYFIADQKFLVSAHDLQAIKTEPGIRRAEELLALGRTNTALSEWRAATRNMNDQKRHAAAKLALEWQLPNWSILALSNAVNKNDLELRFPLMHTPNILNAAKRHQLDPAWIFAVTRQESAFVADAKSVAGALGLMQLMPSTASMVAKRHQIPLKSVKSVLDPHTNIQLGSSYLKMMLEMHQYNPVLATAAYNAGPGRVKKWLPEQKMEADTWVATIPFKETREYVENVMVYTAIYQQLLGKKPALSVHMPHIIPKQ